MKVLGTLGKVLTLALLVVVGLLALGAVLGQPILLSYVETGSMSPTLEPGDGFVAVPTEIAGPVEEGNVIVFEAEEIQGGGLTTHRVVGETDHGYVTRGDANPFTDQDDEEPPVQDAQVVAKALTVGGEVVVLPNLGTSFLAVRDGLAAVQRTLAVVLGTRHLLGAQGLGYLLFAVTAVLYAADAYRESNAKRRGRTTNRETGFPMRWALVGLAALLVVGATAAMVAPAGTQEYGIVSAEFESDRPGVIPTGESKTRTYRVPNGGALPVQVYLEPASEGVAVEDRRLHVPSGRTAETRVMLTAPSETGYYRRFLVEYRYLAILPAPVIDALYEFHPWTPVVAVDALLAGGFLALTLPFVPSGRVRNRTRETGGTLGGLERRLRRLFG
jgi:signal peptidase